MMMLRTKILIAYGILSISLFGQDQKSSIDVFLANSILKHASVGICVKDISGKTIISHNAEKSLTPASTTKIITTATALELFGSDYCYQTTLEKDKLDPNLLLIRGSGDPTLGTKHLNNKSEEFLNIWGDAIAKEFINKKIRITVIDNLYGYEGISPRWTRQDMGNYYAAGAYGISVFDNTYQLYFNTVRQDTCPIILKTEPSMDGLVFRNTLKMNTSGQDNGYIVGEPFSNNRTLTGNIPAGRNTFSIKGDIPNPGLYLARRISETLQSKFVSVKNYSTTYAEYYNEMFSKQGKAHNGTVFYTHKSAPMSQIIENINFKSNNHYAEHLIRKIGRLHNNDIYSSALDEGIKKIKEFWKSHKLNTNSLFLYDGCGLAPSNAVSTAFMCDVLNYMRTKSNNSKVFFHSIPLAGKEGTVRNFLKGTRLSGKVRAKSGSITNVRCYAGYYTDGNKTYSFSIMINNYYGNNYQLIKSIEKLMLGILL